MGSEHKEGRERDVCDNCIVIREQEVCSTAYMYDYDSGH